MHFHTWKRRQLMTRLGSAPVWPMAARAQQATMSVVGFLRGPSGFLLWGCAGAAKATRVVAVPVMLSILAAAIANAAEVRTIKRMVKGHKEVVVQGHVSFHDDCAFRALPEIHLDEAPKGGTVCMRQATVRVEFTWQTKHQHCLGRRISGVQVIYAPYANFAGNDAVRYVVKRVDLVTGAVEATRTFEVDIRVESSQVPSDTTRSSPEPQQAGPMPECPALVS